MRAKRDIARLLLHAGERERAEALAGEAYAMESRLERFWVPDRRLYAMALDGEGPASAAQASNQGHALWSAALSPARAGAVRDALMGDELFSGWGIRTLGRHEVGYNPVGYHLGTVWPHDTALCAAGLRHYGYDDDFVTIFEALLEAASTPTTTACRSSSRASRAPSLRRPCPIRWPANRRPGRRARSRTS